MLNRDVSRVSVRTSYKHSSLIISTGWITRKEMYVNTCPLHSQSTEADKHVCTPTASLSILQATDLAQMYTSCTESYDPYNADSGRSHQVTPGYRIPPPLACHLPLFSSPLSSPFLSVCLSFALLLSICDAAHCGNIVSVFIDQTQSLYRSFQTPQERNTSIDTDLHKWQNINLHKKQGKLHNSCHI